MKTSLLKAAVTTAILSLAAGSAFAQPGFATLKHATQLRASDTIMGQLEQSHPMHVVMSLKLRHEAELNAFLADPNHPLLTQQQFRAKYSPTWSQAQSVANFLKQSGFTNITIAPNRLLVSGDAPAGTTATAFHTSFIKVLTKNGRHAYATGSDVKIPGSLQGTVLAVLGLQTVHQARTFIRRAHPNGVHVDAGGGSAVGHNPTDFASIYGASSLPAATSITVGIITEGSMTNVESDLQQFTSNNGLPTVNVQVVGSGSSDTSGDGEWDLDSQDIVGMSGVQNLILYDAASLNDSDLTSDYNAVVSANAVKIINVSLGECETSAQSSGSAATDDNIFKQAEAQGQTFSVSSGDSGADECGTGGITPSYPASSPYVVAVGGTEVFTSGTTSWASETVWNELASNEGATGGSPSTFEPMPSWQSGVGQNAGSSYRGVPDIAFDGDPNSGANVIVDGASQQIGGTSLASPLFVGAWARIMQAKGTSLGFAAPLIYQAASANYANDFHDITSGNNSGETAAAGWDYCSGFGSLIVSNIVNDIGSSGGGVTVPTASNGSVTTSENTAVSGTLSASASSGAALTFSIVSQPAHGSVSLTNASTGAFTYTPASGYSGSDSFTFNASDSAGTSNTATESVTVNGTTNATPTASNGSVTTNAGTAVSGTLSASDTDGDALTFAVVSNPANGTVSITNASTGAFTYTPNSGFSGSDSFTFHATDSAGNVSNTATESVTVNPVSSGGTFNSTDTPVAINDNATITDNIAVSGLSGNAPATLQVSVNITHNWSGDLEIDLIAPDGTTYVLQSPDYNNDGNINTTYTVNASSDPANGTWTLQVIDNDPYYLGDSGTLNSWGLTF